MSSELYAAAEEEIYDASDPNGGNADQHVNKKSRLGVERWTKEEEDQLLQVVTVTGSKNWEEVVKLMDTTRTAKAYYHKYQDLMRAASASAPSVLLNLNTPLPSLPVDDELYDAAEGGTESSAPWVLGNTQASSHHAFYGSSNADVGVYRSPTVPRAVVVSGQLAGGRVPCTLWSGEEDSSLLDFIEDHIDSSHVPWSRIEIGERTRKACSNRWDYLMKNALVPPDLLERYLSGRVISTSLASAITPILTQQGIPLSVLTTSAQSFGGRTTTTSQTCQTDATVGAYVDATTYTHDAGETYAASDI